jgi:hypothetical protein
LVDSPSAWVFIRVIWQGFAAAVRFDA